MAVNDRITHEAVKAAINNLLGEAFAFRDFGRWQGKARAHGAAGSRYRVEAFSDGQPVQAVLICPALPSRRRSAPLSRYDRLAPPVPDDTAWS